MDLGRSWVARVESLLLVSGARTTRTRVGGDQAEAAPERQDQRHHAAEGLREHLHFRSKWRATSSLDSRGKRRGVKTKSRCDGIRLPAGYSTRCFAASYTPFLLSRQFLFFCFPSGCLRFSSPAEFFHRRKKSHDSPSGSLASFLLLLPKFPPSGSRILPEGWLASLSSSSYPPPLLLLSPAFLL